jgi:hypothetical protein
MLWPLLLPLGLLLPGLNAFPYPNPESAYSDLVLAHYPYTAYLRAALLEGGRLPFWSPIILSGHPLAANPLAGMWYPPGWLALLLPLPLGFNLSIAAHLLWGGAGAYALARLEGRSHRAALLAGLTFTFMPKLFAHYGAGHLTLLYAVAWTPWLLWAARRRSGRTRWPWPPAILLALIFLADPRWAAYAGALWWGYALFQPARGTSEGLKPRIVFQLPRLFVRTLMAALLAAPLALPLLEFARRSSRANMAPEEVFSFSLPPGRLLGLAFPDFGGFHEWMLYPGALILLLALLAILWRKPLDGVAFWIWSALLSLLLSLGSALPLLPALARLPLFELLRVPARALFITGLSMAILAADALDELFGDVPEKDGRRARLLLLLLAAFALSFAGVVWLVTGELSPSFAWGGIALLFGAVWIALRLGGRVSAAPWFLGVMVFCLLDLALVSRSLFDPRPAREVFAEGAELAAYLAEQPGQFRVYSPSYSLPQQAAADYRLELADGVDPLQLQSYVDFMEAATGVPWDGYSVTLPPFAEGEPQRDNAPYRPDPALLGWLNVRYLAAQYDLEVAGLELVRRFGETRLYENLLALPRAWVKPADSPVGENTRSVDRVAWTPDAIAVEAEGPGLLVLAELAYPGWRVQIDGKPGELYLVAGMLRGVQLGPGRHEVVFAFRPLSLYLGLGLWAFACLFLAFDYHRSRKYSARI